MGKTQQQYKDEHYAAGLKQVDKLHGQRKETDAATLKQISEAIDKATATQTGQYQQRIDAAPLESRVEYDQNAINDAVSKKRIQETLANMGVTDSGLTSSMQTALAIQKQKADRSVKVNENAKIQAAQNAIDSILADAEAKKADAKIQRETATADWYAAALADLDNSTNLSAAEAYAADREYDAKVYDAQQKYGAQVIADQNAAIEKQNKAIQDAVQGYIDTGDDPETAKAKVNLQYPSADAYTNLYYEGIRNGYSPEEAKAYAGAGGGESGEDLVANDALATAQKFVNGLNLNVTHGWTTNTFWGRADEGDGQALADKVKSLIEDNAQFKSMSKTAQDAVRILAVAQAVTSDRNWTNHEKNYKRMKKACNVLGIDYADVKYKYNQLNGL